MYIGIIGFMWIDIDVYRSAWLSMIGADFNDSGAATLSHGLAGLFEHMFSW